MSAENSMENSQNEEHARGALGPEGAEEDVWKMADYYDRLYRIENEIENNKKETEESAYGALGPEGANGEEDYDPPFEFILRDFKGVNKKEIGWVEDDYNPPFEIIVTRNKDGKIKISSIIDVNLLKQLKPPF